MALVSAGGYLSVVAVYVKDGKETEVPVVAWSDVDGAMVLPPAGARLVAATRLDEVGMFSQLRERKDPADGLASMIEEVIAKAMPELEKMFAETRAHSPVGHVSASSTPDPTQDSVVVEMVASVCHDVNTAYSLTTGEIGHVPWEGAPQWQKDSSIRGVRAAFGNVLSTPESQHAAWMNDKIKDGWKYGPVKDPEKKTHPCMVPYAQLPANQRVKDHLFLAVVRAAERILGVPPVAPNEH